MMGLDSMLHRKPSRSAPSIRYRIATRIVTCTIQHPYPQHSVMCSLLGQKAAQPNVPLSTIGSLCSRTCFIVGQDVSSSWADVALYMLLIIHISLCDQSRAPNM